MQQFTVVEIRIKKAKWKWKWVYQTSGSRSRPRRWRFPVSQVAIGALPKQIGTRNLENVSNGAINLPWDQYEWTNELRWEKLGFELSSEWMKRWKGGAGLFTHLINKYESPRKLSTKVKSALSPVGPFDEEELWPMTWPVDTMGVPAWSHLLHLKPIKFFPHFIRRLCHSWHIIQRRRRPVGKPVRQKSPLGRLISLVLFFFYLLFFYFSNFILKAEFLTHKISRM